jgi:glycosyltransferase involved in cell wall biosynthesis
LGDGPLMGQLKLLSGQLGIGCKVIFHGANSNVAGFLSRLDLFVLSSLSEGLPIAVLEAMSAGLPIVSTRVGGIPEVALEHSVAVYCPPGEPEAMADAIVGVLDPARMRTMGQTGQSIAQKSFTIEAMCLRYEALYRAVLSSKSSIT